MAGARQRVKKHRRQEIAKIASPLQDQHHREKELSTLYEKALRSYGPRILDNVDLDRLPDLRSRAAVAPRAMIDRGDARAFVLGRQMLDLVQAMAR